MRFRLLVTISSCFVFSSGAHAQTAVFYRIVAGTNSAIAPGTAPGALAWTNAGVGSAYSIEWAFSLAGFAAGAGESIEYGTVTAATMNAVLPIPTTPRPAPASYRLIPAGKFRMGNADPLLPRPTESPLHEVPVSAVYMDKCEVRKDFWDAVRSWGATNGYTDLAAGVATAGDHPAQTLTWYDCVKWCNARSQRDGLAPVYFTDAARTNLYRTGTNSLDATFVLWEANGYRLPTEAEWERAARGGLVGNHFPWPSTNSSFAGDIDGTKANYRSSSDAYETPSPSDTETTPVGYYNSAQVIGGIVQGSDMTNGYGLYDMAGNVSEWCWDWYSTNYYSTFPTNAWPADPTGPTGGIKRVTRGCNWNNVAGALRCAYRTEAVPSDGAGHIGFRCVRGL